MKAFITSHSEELSKKKLVSTTQRQEWLGTSCATHYARHDALCATH